MTLAASLHPTQQMSFILMNVDSSVHNDFASIPVLYYSFIACPSGDRGAPRVSPHWISLKLTASTY